MHEQNELKREKPKFFVVKEVEFCAENNGELREFLENNETDTYRIIKGFEVFPKKKTVYSF